jgi:hypothetical protein
VVKVTWERLSTRVPGPISLRIRVTSPSLDSAGTGREKVRRGAPVRALTSSQGQRPPMCS